MSSPEFREVQAVLAPKLSEFSSKINQNEALFKRIKTVYDNAQENPLDSDQQRVVELVYKGFAMRGAAIDAKKKNAMRPLIKNFRYYTINFRTTYYTTKKTT